MLASPPPLYFCLHGMFCSYGPVITLFSNIVIKGEYRARNKAESHKMKSSIELKIAARACREEI